MINNLIDGARLAIGLGIAIMLVNGVTMRFTPSKQSMTELIGGWTGGMVSQL